MPGRDRLAALAALALLGGCFAPPPAPPGFLPKPEEAPRDGFGGWASVRFVRGEAQATAAGELIAVSSDSLWLLTRTGGITVALVAVREATLWGYDPAAGNVEGAAALGTLSTISNGAYLILTAPMWIIGGTAAAGVQSNVSRTRLTPGSGWRAFRPYARFPQGLPPGVKLSDLRNK